MAEIGITNAGKRNDRIYREGAPTSDVKGKVGQLYIDVTNNDVYVATDEGTWLKAISNGAITAGGMSKKLLSSELEPISNAERNEYGFKFKDSQGNYVNLEAGKTYLMLLGFQGYPINFLFNCPDEFGSFDDPYSLMVNSTPAALKLNNLTFLSFYGGFYKTTNLCDTLILNCYDTTGANADASVIGFLTVGRLYELS